MASPGLHRPGVLARVSGLEATPALNGEVGKLLRLTEEGRWVVQTGAGLSAIRSENLSPAADVVPESLRRLVACAAAVTANLFLELARSGGSRRVTAAAVPVLLAVWGLCHTFWGTLAAPPPGMARVSVAGTLGAWLRASLAGCLPRRMCHSCDAVDLPGAASPESDPEARVH